MKPAKYLFLLVVLLACQPKTNVNIEVLDTPISALLQAISFVDEQTIWASGHEGTFVRSIDGGANWEKFMHPTGDTLQFRDIHGIDASSTILMSAGPGPLSRIFSFSEVKGWQQHFVMEDSLGFLDCMDFWDDQRGIAYGDSFDGYPYILLTYDGGKTWNRISPDQLPKAGEGEGGFAASGTCVTTAAAGKAWIATGAGGNARFLSTNDYGQSWSVVESPIVKGAAAGNTSISVVDHIGFAVGGDLRQPQAYTDNCAFSKDGGKTWALAPKPVTKGAFYGGAMTHVNHEYLAFACGPNGIDYSDDFGKSWHNLDTLNYWAVAFKNRVGFAVGKEGNILKIKIQ